AHLALHAPSAGGPARHAPPGPQRASPDLAPACAGLCPDPQPGRTLHRPAGAGPRLLAEPHGGDHAAAGPGTRPATAAVHGPGRAAGRRADDRRRPQSAAAAAAQRPAAAGDLLQPRLPGAPLPAVRHPDHPGLPAAARGTGDGLAATPGAPAQPGAGHRAGTDGGQPGATTAGLEAAAGMTPAAGGITRP